MGDTPSPGKQVVKMVIKETAPRRLYVDLTLRLVEQRTSSPLNPLDEKTSERYSFTNWGRELVEVLDRIEGTDWLGVTTYGFGIDIARAFVAHEVIGTIVTTVREWIERAGYEMVLDASQITHQTVLHEISGQRDPDVAG